MSDQQNTLTIVLEVINQIKFTAFNANNVTPESYLGGDLGIDSVEMLEVWYDIEQALQIKVGDHEKRDLYTLKDVLAVVEQKLPERAEAVC